MANVCLEGRQVSLRLRESNVGLVVGPQRLAAFPHLLGSRLVGDMGLHALGTHPVRIIEEAECIAELRPRLPFPDGFPMAMTGKGAEPVADLWVKK